MPAASIAAGSATAAAGQTVSVQVSLQTQAASISGLQFDLAFDKNIFSVTVAAGSSTTAAGKSVSTSVLPNGIRVLIVGFNQTQIMDGAVAVLSVTVAPGTAAGTYPLTISNTGATDPAGQPVALDASSGAVAVGGGSPALSIALTHSGTIAAGAAGFGYTASVSNLTGATPTNAAVTVVESLPSALTLVSMSGTGWTCSGTVCGRSDPLSGGNSYPPIAITVNVSSNASGAVVNQATVLGGGSSPATTSDTAVIGSTGAQAQTITFSDLAPIAVGAGPYSLNATASSGLPVTFSSATLSICTVSGNALTVLAVGTCSITASQSGNATFAAASPVTKAFAIQKGSQTITFASLPDVAINAAPITLSATASSALSVTYTSNSPAVCSVAGNVLTVIAAGACSVTASQAGDSNYSAATPVTRAFMVIRSNQPVISSGGVVPVYSTNTTIQPGSWISIYGVNLAPSTIMWNGNFPTSLGGVTVTINGKPGYLWFVSSTQINLQAPDDDTTGNVNVVVTTPNGSFTSTVTLAPASPALSLVDTSHVAALTPNAAGGFDVVGQTGAFPYPTHPVGVGDALVLYGVGFGPTNPPSKSGQIVASAAATANPVTVTIAGVDAPVIYSGIVAAGLYQINVTVPKGVPSGDQPIRASVSGIQTSAGIVVAIR